MGVPSVPECIRTYPVVVLGGTVLYVLGIRSVGVRGADVRGVPGYIEGGR